MGGRVRVNGDSLGLLLCAIFGLLRATWSVFHSKTGPWPPSGHSLHTPVEKWFKGCPKASQEITLSLCCFRRRRRDTHWCCYQTSPAALPPYGLQVPGLRTSPRLLQENRWTCGSWRLAILFAPFCYLWNLGQHQFTQLDLQLLLLRCHRWEWLCNQGFMAYE